MSIKAANRRLNDFINRVSGMGKWDYQDESEEQIEVLHNMSKTMEFEREYREGIRLLQKLEEKD